MFNASLNRLLAAGIVCSLLFQSCQSGLRAIAEEEPVLKQECLTPADHVQDAGEALYAGALALVGSRADARVSGVSSSELVSAAVPASPQFFAGPFTASSGECVLLRLQQGQWQAVLQDGAGTMMHRRTLPVVSSGDIRASLASWQGEDAWSSRSRIHVLAAPTPPYSPCVYVGQLGLLGGAPTQQAQAPAGEWLSGLPMILDSNDESDGTFHIPEGYRFKGCRLKEGAVVQRASLTINYIAAENEEEYCKLASSQSARAVAAGLGVHVGQVVTLGKVEGSVGHSAFMRSEDYNLRCTKHAGLVWYGSTKKNKMCRPRSMINVQVEILVEQVEEISFDNSHSSSFSSSTAQEREDTKPPAQDPSPPHQASSFATSQITPPFHPFGAKAWARYFGEVGAEPSLPSDIDRILSARCSFWPEKEVRETHLLVLIPSKVDGKPFSLNLLRGPIQSPRGGGHSTVYRDYDLDVRVQLGAQSPGRSYWVLMTRDVLEGSRNKTYADQQAMVADHARRTGLPYELPGALEAATAILLHYVRSGERLYSDSPWIYTRCRELVNNERPAVVGGFSSGGLRVGCDVDSYDDGVAVLRKF